MESLLKQINISHEQTADALKIAYSFRAQATGAVVTVEDSLRHQPSGISSAALKAGIKHENIFDIGVIKLHKPACVAGVFTRNRCASPSVVIDREHVADGKAQALVVISKNANLYTPTADSDTRAVIEKVASETDIKFCDVLISCTGVIGRTLPLAKVQLALSSLENNLKTGLIPEIAEAILTTDTCAKVASVRLGELLLCGFAKGAGMIEPNMATMLAYFFTNIAISPRQLKEILREVADLSFNSISIDTDTSTSDTVLIFSTGEIPADSATLSDFKLALLALALNLSHKIVYRAEGATKLIQARVSSALNNAHARAVAKFIVNSPLIKTAIFGADPNWGRIVMAIGKPISGIETAIDPSAITIAINDEVLFHSGRQLAADLGRLSSSIKDSKFIDIHVCLGEGDGEHTAWGCDLSYDYVKINAEYTT